MDLQDLVTDAMCALNEIWLSRTTPWHLAVGTEITKLLSTELVRSHELARKKRKSVLSGFSLRW